MKRSEINACIREFESVLQAHRFHLPPFLHFAPADWQTKGSDYDEIRDNQLGWDLTDFGSGNFRSCGMYLITLRNGNPRMDKYTKPYAEKIMMLKGGQTCPCHFHWHKTEDIINRGGGNVVFRLWNAGPDELPDRQSPVTVYRDGRKYTVPAGSEIVIRPGESLTLYPGCYHEFTVRSWESYALIGEVSMCNDDDEDNRFEKPVGRFPAIDEDEPPYRLLCGEYPAAR